MAKAKGKNSKASQAAGEVVPVDEEDQVVLPGEPIIPVVSKRLKFHRTYRTDAIARLFWRASYRPTRNYTTGFDAMGGPLIWPHPREEPDSYDRRKTTTKVIGFCGPIVRQFNDFAFRKEADRNLEKAPPILQKFYADCDGHGTPFNTFQRRCLLFSQVEREVYTMPYNPMEPGTEPTNVAQMEKLGARPLVRMIRADDVVNWEEDDGHMTAAVIRICVDGEQVARYINQEYRQDFVIAEEVGVKGRAETAFRVVSAGPELPHKYGGLPLVRQRPLFDDLGMDEPGDAQIGPPAEGQQAIANYLSLANEEIFDNAFSQFYVSGCTSTQMGAFKMGSGRVILLPDAAAKLNRIGADPEQSELIEKAMARQTADLYRHAGIESADPTKPTRAPESGLAKSFKFQNLAATLSGLVDSCEDSENRLRKLMANAWGFDGGDDVKYPDNFDIPDYSAEMQDLIGFLTVPTMPPTLKKVVVDRFVDRNLNVTDEEREELDDEMEARADASNNALTMGAMGQQAQGDPTDPVDPNDSPNNPPQPNPPRRKAGAKPTKTVPKTAKGA